MKIDSDCALLLVNVGQNGNGAEWVDGRIEGDYEKITPPDNWVELIVEANKNDDAVKNDPGAVDDWQWYEYLPTSDLKKVQDQLKALAEPKVNRTVTDMKTDCHILAREISKIIDDLPTWTDHERDLKRQGLEIMRYMGYKEEDYESVRLHSSQHGTADTLCTSTNGTDREVLYVQKS